MKIISTLCIDTHLLCIVSMYADANGFKGCSILVSHNTKLLHLLDMYNKYLFKLVNFSVVCDRNRIVNTVLLVVLSLEWRWD